MEVRKWEELNMDCLVNAFGRLGMESLLLDVPFVCKSWYNATLNPLCWQHLDFPNEISDSFKSRLVDEYRLQRFDATGLIKFVVNRSGGFAVSLVLPSSSTKDAFVCAAEGCPGLKFLTLPYLPWSDTSFVPSLISKWKNLQMLRLVSCFNMEEILTQVSLHCKNFVDLGISRALMDDDATWDIVTLLPNLEYLDLRHARFYWFNLVRILKRCKKLVHFDVRDCKGFQVDDKILKLASHIPTFLYEGSRMLNPEVNSSDEDCGFCLPIHRFDDSSDNDDQHQYSSDDDIDFDSLFEFI